MKSLNTQVMQKKMIINTTFVVINKIVNKMDLKQLKKWVNELPENENLKTK